MALALISSGFVPVRIQPKFRSTSAIIPFAFNSREGTAELLHACRLLWSDGIQLELLVAGVLDSGNRSAISDSELAELQADPRIRCLGRVDDMQALGAASDIVVLPSWREGLSRALIEAAAMERPIVTTDVPGCRDVVDHGVSGLLVPLRDAPAIELAVRLLVENPVLRAASEKLHVRKWLLNSGVTVNKHARSIRAPARNAP